MGTDRLPFFVIAYIKT